MKAAEWPGPAPCAGRAVSFIVPAFNEEHLLGQTLDAINRVVATIGIVAEVIVADDASDDGTAALARSRQARVISVNHRHIAATRNAGARAASGEWLIFVDADTLVTEALTRAALASLDGGAVGGGCRVRLDGRLPLYGRLLAASLLPVYRALRLAAGCFIFCTREAFEAAGGFDETLFAAEEAVLSRALGRQGRFIILNEYVTTSGRKLRTHSGREILGGLLRLALTGRKAVRRRDGLEIWYGERRKDPGSKVQQP
jgi:glycosyltransferase involved in cell wall biosynthesis